MEAVMSQSSFYPTALLLGLLAVSPAFSQATAPGLDETEWSRQRIEAEALRIEREKQDFIDLQQEVAAQQETRRRMAAEEDRRLGPAGVDSDPLRGTSDFNREVESQRQRTNSERWQ
jgi:hypothetical protein